MMKAGTAEMPTNHRHPRVGTTIQATSTINMLPGAAARRGGGGVSSAAGPSPATRRRHGRTDPEEGVDECQEHATVLDGEELGEQRDVDHDVPTGDARGGGGEG